MLKEDDRGGFMSRKLGDCRPQLCRKSREDFDAGMLGGEHIRK
jgi:hypothetical protein